MRHACATSLLCLALTAGAVRADVLVTTDGSVVETQGPWQQRGKLIVFTLENGRLSSLRASDVDFEATARWKEELAGVAAPRPAAAPPPAKARMVITDADVSHSSPVLESEVTDTEEGSGGETAAGGSAARQSAVRVTEWDDEEPADGRGRRIFGTVRNDGNTFATDIGIEITVYGDDGVVLGTAKTAANAPSLRPGESATFSVQFPDVFVVGATRFVVSSLDLDIDGGDGTATEEL